jgi:uncharacterized membrane protein YcaP (DUF421 family)
MKADHNNQLIVDGIIQYDNLHEAGLTPEWLLQELAKKHISAPQEVSLALLTKDGTLTIEEKF